MKRIEQIIRFKKKDRKIKFVVKKRKSMKEMFLAPNKIKTRIELFLLVMLVYHYDAKKYEYYLFDLNLYSN